MEALLNLSLAKNYTSNSQKARIITETWVSNNMFCPVCGNIHIIHFENNRPVADFYCDKCQSEFELKSKKGLLGQVIADGAYDTMISRITSNQNPDFLFMSYSLATASIANLLFIPKHFITPSIIEKRNPLSSSARRAGWTGCNILFGRIPKQGRIPIIADGVVQDKETTLILTQKASLLQTDNIAARGWLLDVLNCVNQLPCDEFSIGEVYKFEEALHAFHPNNNNVRAKIRQQLQFLRDKGFVEFLGNGNYRKCK